MSRLLPIAGTRRAPFGLWQRVAVTVEESKNRRVDESKSSYTLALQHVIALVACLPCSLRRLGWCLGGRETNGLPAFTAIRVRRP